jgi:H+/Cl- antiporter ClcA
MLLDDKRIADQVLRRSPWFSGSFYLAAVLLLLTALTVVAGNVSALAFPLVIAGAFAGLTIVGALQLRNDDRLSEKGFLHVIDLAMRRVLLPLSRRVT